MTKAAWPVVCTPKDEGGGWESLIFIMKLEFSNAYTNSSTDARYLGWN